MTLETTVGCTDDVMAVLGLDVHLVLLKDDFCRRFWVGRSMFNPCVMMMK